jgi:outer membrane protein TolC
MKNRVKFIVAAIICALPGFAQEVLPLDQALSSALQHNHALKIAQYSSEQASNKATMGNAGLLPNLNASAGANVSQQNSNLEFATGQTQDVQGAQSLSQNASLGVSQMLFAGGRLQQSYKLLKNAKVAADLSEQQALESTVAMVWSQYTGLILLQRSVATTNELVQISKQRYDRAMQLHALGGSNTTERLAAEVDLNRDSITYLNAQTQFNAARNSFASFIGWSTSDFTVEEEGITLVSAIDANALERLREGNTALKLAKLGYESAQVQSKLQKATLFPTLSAQASYGLNQSQAEAGFLTASQQVGLNAGVNVQYALFSGFQSRSQRQNAELEVLKAEEQLAQVTETLENLLENAIQVFDNASKVAAIEWKNAEVAKLRMEKVTELHTLGKASSLELREAQLGWLNAENGKFSALFQAKNAEIAVLQLLGGTDATGAIQVQ